jgi:hypothetical protein
MKSTTRNNIKRMRILHILSPLKNWHLVNWTFYILNQHAWPNQETKLEFNSPLRRFKTFARVLNSKPKLEFNLHIWQKL